MSLSMVKKSFATSFVFDSGEPHEDNQSCCQQDIAVMLLRHIERASRFLPMPQSFRLKAYVDPQIDTC